MQVFIRSLVFLALIGVSNFLVSRFLLPRLPKQFTRSKLIMRIAAYLFAFIGILFIMNWGTNITVIQTQQGTRTGLARWIWWILSAVFFGIASLLLSRADRLADQQSEDKKSGDQGQIDTPKAS